ncbi:hypothetical protein DITRI_Ditri20bG0067100 [Diplodiscus trichospermus]
MNTFGSTSPVQYGFDSCIMGQVLYIIPRLVIGVFIQVLCSYSTLPLYAIVTQMGSSFKKAIFDERVQAGLVGWAKNVKKKKGLKAATEGATQAGSQEHPPIAIQMGQTSLVMYLASVYLFTGRYVFLGACSGHRIGN